MRRPGIVNRYDKPVDVSPSSFVPAITVEVRAFWPGRAVTLAEMHEAFEASFNQAWQQLQANFPAGAS